MTTQREKQESSQLDITLEDKEEDNDDGDDLDARKELNNKWKGILHFTGTMILMHGEEYNFALLFPTLEDNFLIPIGLARKEETGLHIFFWTFLPLHKYSFTLYNLATG